MVAERLKFVSRRSLVRETISLHSFDLCLNIGWCQSQIFKKNEKQSLGPSDQAFLILFFYLYVFVIILFKIAIMENKLS